MTKIKYIPKYDLSKLSKSRKIRPNLAWYTVIVTWFYVGFIPLMPGTFGSLACYPLYYFILRNSSSFTSSIVIMWASFAVLLVAGYFSIRSYQDNNGSHDHKTVVIDEVLGMMMALCLCFPQCYKLSQKLYKYIDLKPSYLCFLIIFIIFRYFDIRKPLFIGHIDKYITNAFGVILDDLLAGVYTALIVIASYEVIGKFI